MDIMKLYKPFLQVKQKNLIVNGRFIFIRCIHIEPIYISGHWENKIHFVDLVMNI